MDNPRDNYTVNVAADYGYLLVCLCDKACDGHMKISEVSERFSKLLLHVKDENGDIVPLTSPEVIE